MYYNLYSHLSVLKSSGSNIINYAIGGVSDESGGKEGLTFTHQGEEV